MVSLSGDIEPVDGVSRAGGRATTEKVGALVAVLSPRLDSAAILLGGAVGEAYRGDATDKLGPLPSLVFRPRNTADVALILSTCQSHAQPLVTQGGRTGLSGGARPQDDEVVLSLERMTELSEVDRQAGTLIADAGVALQRVHEKAEEAGFLFGVDIGSRGSCTIGGNVATNAGGIRVLRYGMFRAQVAGLEVVLADGSVLSSLRGLPKDNSGLDLNQCFIGSEGTLGVVTKACLKLHPLPATSLNALVALTTLAAAQALLERLRQRLGSLLSAFEIIFPEVYEGVALGGFASAPLPVGPFFYALIEIQGQQAADGERFAAELMAAFEDGLGEDVVLSQSTRDYRALWAYREACSTFIFSKPDMAGFDVSLPAARLEDFTRKASLRLKDVDPEARPFVFGHLGDGNLHYIVQTKRPQAMADAVLETAAACGGAISAEHGIGLDKKAWLPLVRSKPEIDAMRRLKRALDPHLILNPGRVFDMDAGHSGSVLP
ncbi:FAD-binding oxidoreductase [Rhizobium sp. C4]|uniref:FAD-binding oxidoreductase n=1 Tax=Rhizobium sp. C4 TaxID=1349800 RepID=UPI001E30CD3D|nr:FAD-binding oxidoreductase [Rhizobium sp. C4]MCD2172492.1 FAD-binding oxidoreductase [Rhizobium sp. C4]